MSFLGGLILGLALGALGMGIWCLLSFGDAGKP